MKYKGTSKGIAEIGKELGCGFLVEGSVRKAGDRIRVTVKVVDANNDEHLWSSTYDNKVSDIFEIQDEISRQVSGSLPNYVLPKNHQRKLDTTNVTAYTYYLKAMRLFNERTDISLKQSLEFFTKATQLDPNFARAYIGMANCYPELGVRSIISYDEGIAGMRTAILRALEIDEDLAEAHCVMSYFAWGEDDYAKAEREARRAIELNPSLADAHFSLGRVLLSTGYPQSALKLIETAHSLDPLSPHYIRYLGLLMTWMKRDSEALELWKQNMKISPFEMHVSLAEYYLGNNEIEKADKEVAVLEALSPSDFNTLALRGYIFASMGDKDSMQKIIKKLDELFKGGATLDRTIGYMGYFFGDIDGFFTRMFRAVDDHVIDSPRMRYAPKFERARKDPRFRELLLKNGLDPDMKEPLY